MASKVLLIEDDPAFRKAVADILKGGGYRILAAGSGRQGAAKARQTQPDLVILDLVLPGIGGLEVCQLLKQDPTTACIPILILTGNDKDGQDISCLDMGADDYLTKPVKAERLLAYCQALLRRSGRARKALRLGALELDYQRKTVLLGKKAYPGLTPKEFGLLYELARQSPEPRDRAWLYKQVWGAEAPSEGALKTVEVHVRRVRLKLGWRSDRWLLAVSGRGYCVVPPSA